MLLRRLVPSVVRPSVASLPQVLATVSRQQSTKSDGLEVELRKQVLWIKFDRPEKKNAISKRMYEQFTDTFTKANDNNEVKVVLLTGNGQYYSSGNDLTNFVEAMKDEAGPRAGLTKSKDLLFKFVESLINLEKPLIAAVNGPAVGIAVSTLGLCDFVVASDEATFHTPFTALGMCPEACSSVTFPQIMGSSRANELLMLNLRWDARRAKECGLVSNIYPNAQFRDALEDALYSKSGLIDQLFPQATKVTKSLVRNVEMRNRLLNANHKECQEILECWQGPECTEALQRFYSRQKN